MGNAALSASMSAAESVFMTNGGDLTAATTLAGNPPNLFIVHYIQKKGDTRFFSLSLELSPIVFAHDCQRYCQCSIQFFAISICT